MTGYQREEYPEEDYGSEDESRMLIERNIEAYRDVEKPDAAMLQSIYEKVLQKLVQLTETINAEELAFIFKPEQQRIYNLLMAVVVNDKHKTMAVCQALGQGFNRLMRGPNDDYFLDLGVPEEWSTSDIASTLTHSTFEEQMRMFEEADAGLKWQWFTDLEY